MKTWIVSDMIKELQKYPSDTKVELNDADTNWIIVKFELRFENNIITIYPSDYADMEYRK